MYIYIPLCFYLYFFKYISHAPEIRIYIPLCFYLYINPVIQTQTVNEFTFHYASTYTFIFVGEEWDNTVIYIPLCFYLYVDSGRNFSKNKSIYIPLCFYLYGEVRTVTIDNEPIYIPLCFYLYALSDSKEQH